MRDLSLHLLDIIQNSVASGAETINIILGAELRTGKLVMVVEDNGSGMDSALLERVTDPFTTTRTTRKVGLGIPLLKVAAERTSGGLQITSAKGCGTVVEASFVIGNIDRPPLGDMADTITSVILANPDIELKLTLRRDGKIFIMETCEIKERLKEIAITEYEVLKWIREFINEGIIAIFGGVLDEIDSST